MLFPLALGLDSVFGISQIDIPRGIVVNMSIVFGNPNDGHQPWSDSSTVFQLFPVLAPEIRRLIWERELLCPSSPIRKWNNRKFRFALRRPVPPVLQVCRETRLWFIQRSRERSKNALQFAVVQQREGEEGYIYIDWTTDTVFIHRARKRSGSQARSPPFSRQNEISSPIFNFHN